MGDRRLRSGRTEDVTRIHEDTRKWAQVWSVPGNTRCGAIGSSQNCIVCVCGGVVRMKSGCMEVGKEVKNRRSECVY